MNAKIMEGLVGARTSTDLMNTPMRVFEEAERRGDTAVMERAMGYAGDMAEKAADYQTKADQGMEEDAKKTEEEAKAQQEEAIKKRREEREKTEEKLRENGGDIPADAVEISAAGREFVKSAMDPEYPEGVGAASVGMDFNAAEEPVTYTGTGEIIHVEQGAAFSVSV